MGGKRASRRCMRARRGRARAARGSRERMPGEMRVGSSHTHASACATRRGRPAVNSPAWPVHRRAGTSWRRAAHSRPRRSTPQPSRRPRSGRPGAPRRRARRQPRCDESTRRRRRHQGHRQARRRGGSCGPFRKAAAATAQDTRGGEDSLCSILYSPPRRHCSRLGQCRPAGGPIGIGRRHAG